MNWFRCACCEFKTPKAGNSFSVPWSWKVPQKSRVCTGCFERLRVFKFETISGFLEHEVILKMTGVDVGGA